MPLRVASCVDNACDPVGLSAKAQADACAGADPLALTEVSAVSRAGRVDMSSDVKLQVLAFPRGDSAVEGLELLFLHRAEGLNEVRPEDL